MTLSGRARRGRRAIERPVEERKDTLRERPPLREFAYLDEVSVQSLLASQIGALPAEVTSLTARTNETEVAGTVGATAPLIAKAELTSRFSGSSSSSNQVLSRAVSESLFKHLYDLVSDRLAWSSARPPGQIPIRIERGALVEIEVELGPDPIYGFNATMGVLGDLAEDYPAFLNDKNVAMVLAESGPINKVLERLLVGLIPIKATALDLRVGDVDGAAHVAHTGYFADNNVKTSPLHVVGVTEQSKYWRDVRRVLFSKSNFTIFGRVGRTGVQKDWNPVKLTEVMRDIAPQFPDAITRVGRTGYSAPVNHREELNGDALEQALIFVAQKAGGEALTGREDEVVEFAATQRGFADTLSRQGMAFDRMFEWLMQAEIIDVIPDNARLLRSQAREASGLKSDSKITSLADLVTSKPLEERPTESLIDVEIIAIYW